jgi:hypothetical protein
LNETSACVYAIDISLLTAYKYKYVHYRRENTFTSMKTPVRLESHRAQRETFFFSLHHLVLRIFLELSTTAIPKYFC